MEEQMELDGNTIISNVTTQLIKDSIKFAWDKSKSFFMDLDAKDSIKYRSAYETYLHNTFDKLSQIKTIIYRRKPKDLYSFYECVGVMYDNKEIDTSSVINLIANIGTKIIISGLGGFGKSTLFKHLFLNAIKESSFVPVFIELRGLNSLKIDSISIYETVYDTLVNNGFDLNKEYFEYSLKTGAYIFFFDGFDEVSDDRSKIVTREIISFSEKYTQNRFLISSRPSDEFVGWNDFHEASTMPLSKDQACSLISKIDFDEKVKSLFHKNLRETLYDKYESFASNPLLLTIMLLTYESQATISECVNDFYEDAFNTLFKAHDATKEMYVRDIRCSLDSSKFKKVFSYICFKSYFARDYDFSEHQLVEYIEDAKSKFQLTELSTEDYLKDLTLSVCMLVKDGLKYRFAHRSFQEYFAVCYTCKLEDSDQKALLTSWIGELNSVYKNEFFQMLFNIQGDKVNKLILCPLVKELVVQYRDSGFSVDLIKKAYSRVIVLMPFESSEPDIFFEENNKLMARGMSLLLTLNKYSYPDENDEKTTYLIKKIVERLESHGLDINTMVPLSYDELLTFLSLKEILDGLGFFEEQMRFVKDIYEKYENLSANQDKDVSSILKRL